MAITAAPSASIQPASFLRPCLLLLLEEQPGHGYEMRDRLAQLLAVVIDTAVVYRALNAMEDDGLVSSRWERSTALTEVLTPTAFHARRTSSCMSLTAEPAPSMSAT